MNIQKFVKWYFRSLWDIGINIPGGGIGCRGDCGEGIPRGRSSCSWRVTCRKWLQSKNNVTLVTSCLPSRGRAGETQPINRQKCSVCVDKTNMHRYVGIKECFFDNSHSLTVTYFLTGCSVIAHSCFFPSFVYENYNCSENQVAKPCPNIKK